MNLEVLVEVAVPVGLLLDVKVAVKDAVPVAVKEAVGVRETV